MLQLDNLRRYYLNTKIKALIGKELPSQGSIVSKVSLIRDGVVKVGIFLYTPTGS